MKILYILFLLILPCILTSCEKTNNVIRDEPEEQVVTNYYINNQEDFNKWNNFKFPAGSKILFAAGATFNGQFSLRGNGNSTAPNLVTAYDKESGEIFTDWINNKPVIHGEGRVSAALLLRNSSFWEINNIEVTNTDGTKGNQGKLLGINIIAEDVGLVQDIIIRNCYVHRVNGDVGGKETGGIHVHVLGKKIKTKYHKLTIQNNRIAHVGGVGISNQSSWGKINTDDYYPWTNFEIRGNKVEHTGRNGIIVRYAQNPIVEYNKLAYNSRFDTGHSVFNFNTINCVVQYNEAYGNTSNNPDDIDHGGFDADYNSKGTIIQYNYSHDNHWFCGIMRKGYNTDITIRYNISQNELLGTFLYGFPSETGVKDVKVYNNTFYFGKGKGKNVFVQAGKERIPIETVFYNNIFYFEDKADWGCQPDQSCSFQNNLYFNLNPKGIGALNEDPVFVEPGKGGIDIDMTDSNRLSGYKLKLGSPALGAGKMIKNNGNKDFLGNRITENPNIGAL